MDLKVLLGGTPFRWQGHAATRKFSFFVVPVLPPVRPSVDPAVGPVVLVKFFSKADSWKVPGSFGSYIRRVAEWQPGWWYCFVVFL